MITACHSSPIACRLARVMRRHIAWDPSGTAEVTVLDLETRRCLSRRMRSRGNAGHDASQASMQPSTRPRTRQRRTTIASTQRTTTRRASGYGRGGRRRATAGSRRRTRDGNAHITHTRHEHMQRAVGRLGAAKAAARCVLGVTEGSRGPNTILAPKRARLGARVGLLCEACRTCPSSSGRWDPGGRMEATGLAASAAIDKMSSSLDLEHDFWGFGVHNPCCSKHQ